MNSRSRERDRALDRAENWLSVYVRFCHFAAVDIAIANAIRLLRLEKWGLPLSQLNQSEK